MWHRAGAIFRERYHEHVFKTPREVRNGLVYVLNNARKHGIALARYAVDAFSSARWFDGWLMPAVFGPGEPAGNEPAVSPPRTWLQRIGWRRHGLIHPSEVPRGG